MNFNQLVQQAQQMQRKVNKAKKELDAKEYDIVCQNNLITGKMLGSLQISDIHIDESLMKLENKDDLEALLSVTLNQMIVNISKEREDTLDKLTNGVDVSAFL
ncbi:MAG: YbaB/EbfC family nucleoid-associated protein [Coprobacillus sp.]